MDMKLFYTSNMISLRKVTPTDIGPVIILVILGLVDSHVEKGVAVRVNCILSPDNQYLPIKHDKRHMFFTVTPSK